MDIPSYIVDLGRIIGAFVLALGIGWERERRSRSAGLRTFPLVAAASCAYIVLGRSLGATSAESESRIIQGLMTGIGFIGGGTILKSSHQVRGTATAASIWMTGAMGVAAAYGRWGLAIGMSALTFATLWVLTRLEARIHGGEGEPDALEVPGERGGRGARDDDAADEATTH